MFGARVQWFNQLATCFAGTVNMHTILFVGIDLSQIADTHIWYVLEEVDGVA